ncbi:tetratricopeptide repeat protein [Mucilaginibacter pocheonensis]|uniref:Tetratricopeptide (TPR) repeat protein n=1 Tax=Mucilaginibacter pocheonensis TaxID=398050 RepID=A0ABU1T6V3_9SPHI|nr:tetratricopeptide repeat protein [Mucilaginibacter pocheonensis]MDR6941063.1 tetratricopeptide (TPR) repeat protein [Mucilaginibacter pocheonensis]
MITLQARQAQLILFLFLFLLSGKVALTQSIKTIRFQEVQLLGQQHPDSALIVLKKIHARAIQDNDNLAAGMSLQQMGQICFNQGHYAQALDFYLHADKIFGQEGNKDMLAGNMSKMGILYYYNKQSDKSYLLYKKALALYKSTNNKRGQAEVFGAIGHLYEKHHRYDSSFYYQHLALSTYSLIRDNYGKAKIYENLGSIHEDLANYDSSYSCFKKSLDLYRQYHDEVASIEVINNIGDILRKTGKYGQGILQSRLAYTLSLKTNNLYQLAASCRDLGKSYQLLNRLDSAYHYLELSRKYSLEVYSRESLKQTAFLQVLYDMDKKSDEIIRLNNIRKTNQIVAIAVTIIVILLIVLGLVTFSRQRLKIKDQRVLAEQDKSIFEAQRGLMELELKNKQLEEESLKQQLELKSQELSAHTLNLIKNNQLLENMRNTLQSMVKEDKRDQKKQMQQIIQQINQSFNHEQHWKEFTVAFEQVHQRFFDKLKHHSSDLTSTDIRLIALLKVNMDSKDIAGLLGISTDSLRVARYRLRKKLNIQQGENLSTFIQAL